MVRFGIAVVPAAEQLDRVREMVLAADEGRLDLVGIRTTRTSAGSSIPGR